MKEKVTLVGEIKTEREKSIQFKFGEQVVWLPTSQIEYDIATGTVIMPRWLVEAKDLDA